MNAKPMLRHTLITNWQFWNWDRAPLSPNELNVMKSPFNKGFRTEYFTSGENYEHLNVIKMPRKNWNARLWKYFQGCLHYHFLSLLMSMAWWYVTIWINVFFEMLILVSKHKRIFFKDEDNLGEPLVRKETWFVSLILLNHITVGSEPVCWKISW